VAPGHVTIAPPFVDDGVDSDIGFSTPNERPPHATVAVGTAVPAGITVVSASSPPGWSAKVDGQNVTWSGGRLEGRETASFGLRIRPRVRAGTVTFASTQSYDDGATVRWTSNLSVLPAAGAAAPGQHPWGALIAAVLGIVVIAGSLVVARALRRRPLQEK
jgi:uncharacterized protein YcnI